MLSLGLFLKIRIGFCFGEKNKILFLILFLIFKILCCADVENCGISKCFGFIYIYCRVLFFGPGPATDGI